MNLKLSILRRELMALPRRKRFYLKRAGLVALGSVVILWGMGIGSLMGTTTIGLQIFSSLSMALLVAMCLISAQNSSSLIMREKEERTLGLLFLSDISGWDFILGKLSTSLFSTTMAVLSVLPMFMLAISLGGVSAPQVLAAYAVLLSTSFLVACLGVFCSTVSRTERTMGGLLALAGVVFFILLPVMLALVYFPGDPPDELMCVVSPFIAMGCLISGNLVGFALLSCCLNIILGLPFLWLARVILPGRILSKERPPVAQRLVEKMKSMPRIRRWVKPGEIRGNPVAWKDFHYGYGGRRATWLKFAVSAVVIGLCLVFAFSRIGKLRVDEMVNASALTFLIFSAAVFAFGCVSHCGMSFNGEKRIRAIEVLLTTTLTDWEILSGKIKAVLLSVLPWLLCALACLPVVVFMCWDDSYSGQVIFWICAEYLSMLFFYSCLALLISLRYRKNVALAACALAFLVWNTMGRSMVFVMVMALMSVMGDLEYPESIIVMLDSLTHLFPGAICLFFVFSRFRKLALRDANP